MVLKLYVVCDGPPSLSVRQALTKLAVPFQQVEVNFNAGEHLTAEYAQMNPQKEIPVMDDDGFFMSESNAIMQYACDKYKPGSSLYPTDAKARAIVNHRLCYNLSTYGPNITGYTMNPQKEIPVMDDDGFFMSESNAIMQYACDKYKPGSSLYPTDAKARAIVNHRLCYNLSTYGPNITGYTLAPIFFDYERTPMGQKKVHIALNVFETYLERLGSSHAAGDHLTIADFPLINSTMTLEAIDFDFSMYKKVTKWYNDFKGNYPDLWKISEDGMNILKNFEENPPDLSDMDHPIHPIRKFKK